MRHYGERPPAEMFDRFNKLGYWRWIPPDPRSWFDDEPGYWQWYPGPQSTLETMGLLLKEFYLEPIKEQLNYDNSLLHMALHKAVAE